MERGIQIQKLLGLWGLVRTLFLKNHHTSLFSQDIRQIGKVLKPAGLVPILYLNYPKPFWVIKLWLAHHRASLTVMIGCSDKLSGGVECLAKKKKDWIMISWQGYLELLIRSYSLPKSAGQGNKWGLKSAQKTMCPGLDLLLPEEIADAKSARLGPLGGVAFSNSQKGTVRPVASLPPKAPSATINAMNWLSLAHASRMKE